MVFLVFKNFMHIIPKYNIFWEWTPLFTFSNFPQIPPSTYPHSNSMSFIYLFFFLILLSPITTAYIDTGVWLFRRAWLTLIWKPHTDYGCLAKSRTSWTHSQPILDSNWLYFTQICSDNYCRLEFMSAVITAGLAIVLKEKFQYSIEG